MRQIGKALASALKQPKPEEAPEVGSAVASAIPQNQTPVTTLPKTGELRIPSRDMPSLPPGFIGKDGRIVERPVRPPIGINPPQRIDSEGISKYGDWRRGVNDQYSAWQKNQIDQGKKIGIDFMPSDFYKENPGLVNPPPELAPYAPVLRPMSSGFKNIRKYLGKK
jgi:hypothetical protein